MSIVHSKVSGQANTDAGKVGGADWDHQHLHGVGGMPLLGFVRTFGGPDPGGVDDVSAYCFGAITGLTYDSGDHRLMVAIDPAILPIVADGVPDYFMHWRKESPVWCPETLVAGGVTRNGSNQVIELIFDIRPVLGANAQFSQVVELVGLLYVLVG